MVVRPGLPHAYHHAIVASPHYNGTTSKSVFFGTDEGVYKADDITTVGKTAGWQELNTNYAATRINGAAGNAASGVIIAGTSGSGTIRLNAKDRPGAGLTCSEGKGGRVRPTRPTPITSTESTSTFKIYRSHDAGQSAAFIHGNNVFGMPGSPSERRPLLDAGEPWRSLFIAPFILDPNDPE